jgi:hypothetical protein
MPRTNPRHPDPTRRRWRQRWLAALLCGWALSACAGGSGSSGFDAVTAENRAIDQALASQGCETNDGLTICASGAATPTPSGTPTLPPATATAMSTATSSRPPTPLASPTTTQSLPSLTATPSPTGSPVPPSPTRTTTPSPTATATGTTRVADTPTPTATPIPAQPSVDIDIGANDTLPCVESGPRQPCIVTLTFAPRGAPAAAAYRVAVRTRHPDRAWTIVPVTGNSASIPVDPTATDTRYQVAILLFVQDPGFVPDQVELLSDTGADFAFVTPLLTAEQIGIP